MRTSYPPALSKFGELRSGTKADLLECFQDTYPTPTDSIPDVDAILLDGLIQLYLTTEGPLQLKSCSSLGPWVQ